MRRLMIVMLPVCLMAGCTRSGADREGIEHESLYEDNDAQVVLAYEKTRFKEALISEMRKLLMEDSIPVKTVEHTSNGFTLEDPFRYDVVFITNSGVHSRVRPWISEWIEEHQSYADNILLHITQNSSWEVGGNVDAVTSASSMGESDDLAAYYVGRIKAMIVRGKSPGISNDGK